MANKDVVIEARNPRTNQSVQQQVSVVPGERKSVLLRLDKGRQPSQRQ
jgi:hypothetical protein